MSAVFRKILVVVRGSDPAQPVVQRAASLAGRSTEILLLDVVYEAALDGYMGNTAIYEPLRARVLTERAGYVDELVAGLRERGLDVSGEAVWDHPLDEAVLRRVRDKGVDFVVMAPFDAPGGGLSNSDWRLITNCPAPVLVVKRTTTGPYRRIIAAVDPYHTHAKPAKLDGIVLEHARELQARTGAQLSALHCFTPYEHLQGGVSRPPSRTPDMDVRREELERLLRESGLPTSCGRIEIGAPHDVLKRLAETGGADLIIMGALARSRLKEWLIGSTTERVLHAASVDVLAVKPGQTP